MRGVFSQSWCAYASTSMRAGFSEQRGNLRTWLFTRPLPRPATWVVLALAWTALPANAADLPFKILSTGKVNGQVTTGLTEARDRQALSHIWSALALKGAIPKVDFKRRMAVAWVGGGSACDKYVLKHVQESATEVVLDIEHVRPPPGRMCIMIFTPSQFVASIPLTRKPIRSSLPNAASASGAQ